MNEIKLGVITLQGKKEILNRFGFFLYSFIFVVFSIFLLFAFSAFILKCFNFPIIVNNKDIILYFTQGVGIFILFMAFVMFFLETFTPYLIFEKDCN